MFALIVTISNQGRSFRVNVNSKNLDVHATPMPGIRAVLKNSVVEDTGLNIDKIVGSFVGAFTPPMASLRTTRTRFHRVSRFALTPFFPPFSFFLA